MAGRLPRDLPITWSAKLQTTGGRCAFRTVAGQRHAAIELCESGARVARVWRVCCARVARVWRVCGARAARVLR
eukprot:3019076-Prymnesium_polylepis.1